MKRFPNGSIVKRESPIGQEEKFCRISDIVVNIASTFHKVNNFYASNHLPFMTFCKGWMFFGIKNWLLRVHGHTKPTEETHCNMSCTELELTYMLLEGKKLACKVQRNFFLLFVLLASRLRSDLSCNCCRAWSGIIPNIETKCWKVFTADTSPFFFLFQTDTSVRAAICASACKHMDTHTHHPPDHKLWAPQPLVPTVRIFHSPDEGHNVQYAH